MPWGVLLLFGLYHSASCTSFLGQTRREFVSGSVVQSHSEVSNGRELLGWLSRLVSLGIKNPVANSLSSSLLSRTFFSHSKKSATFFQGGFIFLWSFFFSFHNIKFICRRSEFGRGQGFKVLLFFLWDVRLLKDAVKILLTKFHFESGFKVCTKWPSFC